MDQIWRVPDPEYARFHQAVLVGHRVPPRALQTRSQSPWDWADRRSYHLTYPALAARPPFAPVITVPTGRVPLRFSVDPLRPDALAAYLTANAGAFGPLRARTTRAAEPSAAHPVRPPLPLHRGHLATLLAAGVLSGALGTGAARHLVRGRVVPVETTEVATTEGEVVRTTRRSFALTVTTLHPDGTLTTWGPPTPLVTDDAESPEAVAVEVSA